MVRLNKIYTRTGDDGSTGLVGGARISKADARVGAYGDVDETNSALGLAICAVTDAGLKAHLQRIQNDLFDLGADLANPGPDEEGKPVLRTTAAQVCWLEGQIDRLNGALDPLKSFVLPGGCEASARLHLAPGRAPGGAAGPGRGGQPAGPGLSEPAVGFSLRGGALVQPAGRSGGCLVGAGGRPPAKLKFSGQTTLRCAP